MPIPRMKAPATPRNTSAEIHDKNFARMRKHAEKMRFERTGLVPGTTKVYMELNEWYRQHLRAVQEYKMKQNELDLIAARKQGRELARVFGGRSWGDGNVGILGYPTIWSRTWAGTEDHSIAPWPSPREFREEGDERHTSNYGRFLPIPRAPGNKTVNYKQKSFNLVETFDLVMPVPKLYKELNINSNGFFDGSVDERGIPYDDPDAPGKEFILKGVDESEKVHYGENDTEPFPEVDHNLMHQVRDKSIDAAHIFGLHSAPRYNLHPDAAEFVPRNIPALNPGTITKAIYLHEDDDDPILQNNAFLLDFLGPSFDESRSTPVRKAKNRPDTIGFTDPQKAKNVLRGSLRVDTTIKEFHGNGSPTFSQAETALLFGSPQQNLIPPVETVQGFSPATAFRTINPFQQEDKLGRASIGSSNQLDIFSALPVLGTPGKDPRSAMSSPQELITPQSFSARSRRHKSTALDLLGGSLMDLTTKNLESFDSLDLDATDVEDDGGVKLF